ncbi:MAG: hypothetical protein NZM26_04665 [Patescibacteria group bacterium]|nr:hypothetical protein [Patescibacteria group bacterium]
MKKLIQLYVKELNQALKESSGVDVDAEIRRLSDLERRFVKRLCAVAGRKKVYKDFVDFILKEKDLRFARSYFRERENMYKDSINKAIRTRNYKALSDFNANYLFCLFSMNRLASKDQQLIEIFDQMKNLRESLVHKHLHYALNRAKSFSYMCYSSNAIELEDLIQIANEALVVAVDKYVPNEQASSFRVMAIGRMISNLIANSTQIFPVTLGKGSSRQLYQIKRLLEKIPSLSTQDISDIIGVVQEEVSFLLNATAVSRLDEPIQSDTEGKRTMFLLDFLASDADEFNDPFLALEKKDLLNKSLQMFHSLTVLEQKVLRLKGINFKSYTEEDV